MDQQIDARCLDGVDTIIYLAGTAMPMRPGRPQAGDYPHPHRIDPASLPIDARTATCCLGTVCREWADAVGEGERLGLGVVLLRTGVVLTKAGDALVWLAPMIQSGFGWGSPMGSLDTPAGCGRTLLPGFIPARPFDYRFADQEFALKFATEQRIGTLAALFAGLAIFISCLGLLGLASFTAEQRQKEIGIRKVLGASVFTLWGLLTKDSVLLVGIASMLAGPLTYYWLRSWLQMYAYRTELSWWIFAVAEVSALLVTLLTVSYQAIRAALVDPMKSLRSE